MKKFTYPTSFEAWYALYPRKVAKFDAAKAWSQSGASDLPTETLTDAIIWQTAHHEWDQPERVQFCPYPATWLRGRRWEDEPPTVSDAPYRVFPGGPMIYPERGKRGPQA